VPTVAEVEAQKKLAALAAPTVVAPEPKVEIAAQAVRDEAKANEKLANLLGKPK
ncbi:MAG: ABC transporter ATP-binding protein, partial [Verrucomicrobia bacterium]|nr:ABC transporter ATP-binding protein [Verrucomicrobiota bacterium]